ncbi:hypothetical protein [Saprospira grandis]|uniref:hypothetical protein n=1 Tax=Saprospira grandis TaxID=1008 RepID=UPI0002DA818F|nr:hypothetical protein [Saprospira grandis]
MRKSPEIGSGHHTTYFRELDGRMGRWWSTDPITFPHQSPYNTFDGNPIYYTDASGACVDCGGIESGEDDDNPLKSGEDEEKDPPTIEGGTTETVKVVAERIGDKKDLAIDSRNIRISNSREDQSIQGREGARSGKQSTQLERDVQDGWMPLPAKLLDKMTTGNSHTSGFYLEDAWNRFAETSPVMIRLKYERQKESDQYYSPWGRNVAFDGKSNGYHTDVYPGRGHRYKQVKGVAFYEVKRVQREKIYKNYKQIGAQIAAIEHKFPYAAKKKATFYYLVTTADVTDVSSIRNYAESKSINFGHYVAFYKEVNGVIRVKFKARMPGWIYGYNDRDLIGANPLGVPLINN